MTNITASRFLANVLMEPEILADPRHRLILGAILSLMDAGEMVDAVTVADQLARHDLLDQAGGHDFLIEVADSWRPAS
jgi:replicative DNA helicase